MNQKIPRLMSILSERQQERQLKLTKCLPVDKLPDGEIKESIIYGYNSDNIFYLTIAVLMNAIFSSKKKEFILSRSILIECFKRDPNVAPRNFSGDQIKRIVGSMSQIGFIDRITEASTMGGPKRKAAVYRVVLPELLDLIETSRKASR